MGPNIIPQPVSGQVTPIDGNGNTLSVQQLDGVNQLYVQDPEGRRLQEIALLIQQSQLVSVQLGKENTSRYTFLEVR